MGNGGLTKPAGDKQHLVVRGMPQKSNLIKALGTATLVAAAKKDDEEPTMFELWKKKNAIKDDLKGSRVIEHVFHNQRVFGLELAPVTFDLEVSTGKLASQMPHNIQNHPLMYATTFLCMTQGGFRPCAR